MSELTTTGTPAPVTFEWDERRERAAALVAVGEMTMRQIAEAVGVDRNTLHFWRLSPLFNARVSQHVEVARQALLTFGVAAREERIRALHDRWLRLQRVVEERAEAALTDPAARDAPGASTGLLVRQQRVVGSGRAAIVVDEWVLDAALLREIRSMEEHIARELGQWQPKAAIQQVIKLYAGIDLDRV